MNIVINKPIEDIAPGDSLVLNGSGVGLDVVSSESHGDAFRLRVRGLRETYLVPEGTSVAICLPPEHRAARGV